jgi:GH25 family lysozyme M1 (1,4-beta-N-acetylmuramidase)
VTAFRRAVGGRLGKPRRGCRPEGRADRGRRGRARQRRQHPQSRDAADLTAERSATTPRAESAADLQGIDVASHQHPGGAPIDWNQVAGAGYRFVAIKATEGNYYFNDDYYADDRSGAAAAGTYTYPYHFAIPDVSGGIAQADYFLDREQGSPGGNGHLYSRGFAFASLDRQR